MRKRLLDLVVFAALVTCAAQAGLLTVHWDKLHISLPNVVTPVGGPRTIAVLRETETDDRELTAAIFKVRDVMDRTEHRCYILDDDDPGAAKFKAAFAGKSVPSPALVIYGGPQAEVVLFAGDCPKTADTILAEIKKHGG